MKTWHKQIQVIIDEIEELLMCISTTSGYTENGDRTLSCNEVGQILDYINNLEEQIRDDI